MARKLYTTRNVNFEYGWPAQMDCLCIKGYQNKQEVGIKSLTGTGYNLTSQILFCDNDATHYFDFGKSKSFEASVFARKINIQTGVVSATYTWSSENNNRKGVAVSDTDVMLLFTYNPTTAWWRRMTKDLVLISTVADPSLLNKECIGLAWDGISYWLANNTTGVLERRDQATPTTIVETIPIPVGAGVIASVGCDRINNYLFLQSTLGVVTVFDPTTHTIVDSYSLLEYEWLSQQCPDNYSITGPESVIFGTVPVPASGQVSIPYFLRDYDGSYWRITSATYSIDDGATWLPCTMGVGGDGNDNLESSIGGFHHTWMWDTDTDLPGQTIPACQFKLILEEIL